MQNVSIPPNITFLMTHLWLKNVRSEPRNSNQYLIHSVIFPNVYHLWVDNETNLSSKKKINFIHKKTLGVATQLNKECS